MTSRAFTDSYSKLRAQIRAGRELLGLKQADLAKAMDASLSKISRAESGETKSGDTLLELKALLERKGVRFLPSGVEVVETHIEILEGPGRAMELLTNIHQTLKDHDDKTLLLMCTSDRVSPPEVNEFYRLMRREGIKMRQLIEEKDTYLLGPVDEYRTIPARYFMNIATAIYGDRVAQLDGGGARIIVHDDARLAERERKIFNYLWDMGTQPKHSEAHERFET